MGLGHKMGLLSLLHLFVLLISCLGFEFSFSADTLSTNQSLRSSQFLVSNGHIFKFGFFSPLNSSQYYVGVMYNVPVLTAVWVANRGSPLNDSAGMVVISDNGNLVILDGQNQEVWSSNFSGPAANYSATLNDTGNLVLEDRSKGSVIWESFRHASDSFLENMKITSNLRTHDNNILTSWRSPSDPALGSYTASIEPFVIPQLVVRKGVDSYWRSGPWNGQIFIGVPGMETYIYQNGFDVIHDNPEAAYLTFSYFNSSLLLYFALTSSGILQQKVWSSEKEDWEVTSLTIENDCDVYGKCGPFGICNPWDKPICSCLQGFKPRNTDEWNVGNWTGGCIRNTPHQCGNNSSAGETGKQDGFFRLKSVKLPDNVNWFPSVEDDCGSKCLINCSCIAYAYYAGIGCMHWTGSLIDVQKFSTGTAELYIRLAHSELDNKKDLKVIIATTSVLGFMIIIFCTYFLLRLCKGYSKRWLCRANVDGVKLEEFPFYEFRVLLNATHNFDPMYKLGEGGFGSVYKGKLSNGQEIAVKRLARSSSQGMKEFKNEVEVISKLQHRNLVKLLGWCVENEEKILVYEYMPKGSLDSYLFDSHKQEFLDWNQRRLIIEGISRGLLYLHRDSRLKIIHRDLKASNILLDGELNPKISDFGTARIFGGKENQAKTNRVVGTFGYIAPEYALHGRLSEKSDVFSFGVLLLEIVSGMRNASFNDDQLAQSLIAYAWKLWNEKKMTNLMDPLMYDRQVEEEMLRCAHVGLLCVEEAAQDRPSMSAVVSMLCSEIMELPCPKKPAFVVHHVEPSPKFSVNDITVSIVEGR